MAITGEPRCGLNLGVHQWGADKVNRVTSALVRKNSPVVCSDTDGPEGCRESQAQDAMKERNHGRDDSEAENELTGQARLVSETGEWPREGRLPIVGTGKSTCV